MNDEIKKLEDELFNDINEYNLSYAETECLYSLKNYFDKRLELLEKTLKKD
jgi:hypothetical protein